MVFYNVFVAFVGLNNNTISALDLPRLTDTPSQHKNASIGIPILNIGSTHRYFFIIIFIRIIINYISIIMNDLMPLRV